MMQAMFGHFSIQQVAAVVLLIALIPVGPDGARCSPANEVV